MPPVMPGLWQSLTNTLRVGTLRFLIMRMTTRGLTVVLSGVTTPGLTRVLIVIVIATTTTRATAAASATAATGTGRLPGLSDVYLYGSGANRGVTYGNGATATG